MISVRTVVPVIVAVLVFGHLVTVTAQEEQPERQPVGGLAFLDEVEVTIVNIEVYVRNKEGRPVPGLTIDDFEVSQDGQIRNLTNFLYIDESFRPTEVESALAVPTAGPAAGPADEIPAGPPEVKPIHIVIYIDNENLRPFDRNRVLSHVRRFITDTVRPGVEAMIVSYLGSPKIVQNFTSDADLLNDAVRSLRKGTGGRVNRDSERAELVREIDRMRGEDRATSRDDPMSPKAHMVYEDIITYADRVEAENRRDLAALNGMGLTLTGLPGRKALIYVSSGLPMVPAKDLLWEFSKIYTVLSFNSLVARYNQRFEYRTLASTANAQGLTFYTIDAQGLTPNASISADRAVAGDPTAAVMVDINYEEPLTYIAERTGGLATVGTSNFEGGFDLIREDLFTYYSLGYPITAAGGDRVHRVEVNLPNHPELKTRYRKTFVEKSRESRVQDAVMSALLFDVDDNPMGIDATVGTLKPTQEGRWLLPLRVGFPTESVALLPEGENLVGEVVLFVSLRGGDGRQADLHRREQPIHLPSSEYDRLAKLNLSVDLDLLVEEGEYRISVGLMDRLTRQASFKVVFASTPGS